MTRSRLGTLCEFGYLITTTTRAVLAIIGSWTRGWHGLPYRLSSGVLQRFLDRFYAKQLSRLLLEFDPLALTPLDCVSTFGVDYFVCASVMR